MKYSRRYKSYRADTTFKEKFSKGHNFIKYVGGVPAGSFSLYII